MDTNETISQTHREALENFANGKFDRASELLVQNGIFAHHIKGNENGKGERMYERKERGVWEQTAKGTEKGGHGKRGVG